MKPFLYVVKFDAAPSSVLQLCFFDLYNSKNMNVSLLQEIFMKSNDSWSWHTRFAAGTEVIQQNRWAKTADYSSKCKYHK